MKALRAATLTRIGAVTALLAASLAAVSTSASAADLTRGEQLFHTCAACHSVLGDGIGPDITGI